MLERFLLLWLSLLSLGAFYWDCFSSSFDPFVASKPYLPVMFAATMFAIGAMLPRDELAQVARRWPTVLAGTTLQYLSMPLFAWLLATVFQLSGSDFQGVMLAGCVPGAMASNVLTLVARGNTSYSVSLTTSATLLSPLAVPAALWLTLGQKVEFPYGKVMWELTWTVVLPVVFGHLLGRIVTRHQPVIRRVGGVVANLVILWIIAAVVAINRDRLGQLTLLLPSVLILLNLLGYATGYWGGRAIGLNAPMRRALTLEIGMQNAGLGSTLALSIFAAQSSAAVAVAPALYTFGCMFTGTILARGWGMADDIRAGAEMKTRPE